MVSPIAFATPCHRLRPRATMNSREVVDVDHLGAESLERRREDGPVAGEREPADPVAEAVGGVAGPDDESRPHDRRALAEAERTDASAADFARE